MTIETTEKTRYLVMGYSRSGTSVTNQIISRHPNACSFVGELKPSPFFQHGFNIFCHGKAAREEAKEYPALFDALTLINSDENTNVHGAKIACNSPVAAGWIVDVLREYLPDVKVIVTKRTDLVALMGSSIHGAKTGVMHSWNKGFDGRKIHSVKIGRADLIVFMRWVHRLNAVFDQLKETHSVLELEYEKLSGDIPGVAQEMFRFLGLPEIEPTWVTSEKVTPPPGEYIRNYEALSELQRQYENGELSPTSIKVARAFSYAESRFKRLSFRS